jgi:hypothetical protein
MASSKILLVKKNAFATRAVRPCSTSSISKLKLESGELSLGSA